MPICSAGFRIGEIKRYQMLRYLLETRHRESEEAYRQPMLTIHQPARSAWGLKTPPGLMLQGFVAVSTRVYSETVNVPGTRLRRWQWPQVTDISSSNFPRFNVNPNTGEPFKSVVLLFVCFTLVLSVPLLGEGKVMTPEKIVGMKRIRNLDHQTGRQ